MNYLSAVSEEGHDWHKVTWLVQNERQDTIGLLIKCHECDAALGFANIVKPLQVKMEMLIETPNALPVELGILTELPLSPTLLLDNSSKGEEVWCEGYSIMSDAQKEQYDNNRRFLQAIDGIVEGESELALTLAPGFDQFPSGHFEKRQGPLREHLHYQERLASLKWLIDIGKEEVQRYSNALLDRDSLPYPDLVEDVLKSSKQRLEESWLSYVKAKQSENDFPTQLYWVDIGEIQSKAEILVSCSQCNILNTLNLIDLEGQLLALYKKY